MAYIRKRKNSYSVFVLLFASSTIDAEKFQEIAQSMAQSFSILNGGQTGIGQGVLIASGGDVVDLVAHEREVVDDALGRNAVLFNHAVSVVELGVHRVEKRHVLVDELRHVLVARRDDDFHPFGSPFPGKRRNNVVGFDTGHDEKRPPEIRENLLKGRDLHAQIVGHRRTIRLVLGIHRVTEILPGRVENDDRTIGLHHALDAPEHAEKAPHGARRFAVRRGERRQAVVELSLIGI